MSTLNQEQVTTNETEPSIEEILANCSSEFHQKLFEKIHGISSIFNINYALSPKLKYAYPPINPLIIENIVTALISCPKFYTQTLHLMNKMNLPCPLVPYVRAQRPPEFYNQSDLNEKTSQINMEVLSLSETESELESEIETGSSSAFTKNKRQEEEEDLSKNIQTKKLKVKSLIKSAQIQYTKVDPKENRVESVEEAFEKLTDTFQKTSKKAATSSLSKCTKTTETENILYRRAIVQSEFEGFAKIIPYAKQSEISDKNHADDQEMNVESNEFISKQTLEVNRINMSELKELSVFKNYERGEVNTRIYVKNLGKKVEEKDLKFIYGRYIDWSNPVQVNAFDIRLMQEGRMKGQAFITLPSEQIAERALNETLGYVLDEKPIVVQFARSAKPK
jgi:U11/U12 small nuclear ribonucleoprotein 65 kDa protein